MDNNNNTHLAPVIYVAESPEQRINYKWDSGANSLNRNVVVLEPRQIQALCEGKNNFSLPYDLTPGEVLVRHPYNQGYIQASEAEEEYLTAAADGVFLIARCLGATKITYKRCNIVEFEREINSDNSLRYKVVDAKSSTNTSLKEKLLKMYSKTQEFTKQDFTKSQFNKAKSTAEKRGLLMSSDIRSLLDARDPELGSPMTRQTINVEISSSLNKAMDIAFTLNTVPFFNLNSNTKSATKRKLVLNTEWDIIF